MTDQKAKIVSKETVKKVQSMPDSPRKSAILKDLEAKQKGEVKK